MEDWKTSNSAQLEIIPAPTRESNHRDQSSTARETPHYFQCFHCLADFPKLNPTRTLTPRK